MSQKHPLVGKFYKTPDGFDTYEIFGADRMTILAIANILENKFGFETDIPYLGPDGEPIIDCWKGDVKIAVGWDSANGCFVSASDPAGNVAIQTIGNHLDSILDSL